MGPGSSSGTGNGAGGAGASGSGSSGTGAMSGSGTMPGSGMTPSAPAGRGGMFAADAPWYRDISGAPLDRESSQVIAGLEKRGGWGGGKLRVDFSIEVLKADANTSMRPFETNEDFYEPDCDHMPVPIPAGGRIEGEKNYTCSSDGDCHLIVLHGTKLYEMWRANIAGGGATGGSFSGGCLAVWDLKRDYWNTSNGNYGRGNHCTSADAAGLPLSDLLFDADEVKAGEIKHALRFILPNDRMKADVYVPPATHAGGPESTNPDAPPYGVHLRLRPDTDMTAYTEEERVVLAALQRHGMYLSDGG
ncbi:MAG TPA: hypothetical protein VGG33_28595, partial [Polyangia bacterium]